jgi:uncharacterized membrane protein YphA (DoxX/SURF4 family)
MNLVLRILIASLFAISFVGKINDPSTTILFLSDLGFSETIALVLVRVVTVLEIALAGAILIPKTKSAASHASLLLIFIFTMVLLYQIGNNSTVDCGCFGGIGENLGLEFSVIRNVVLLFILAWITKSNNQSFNNKESN